MIGGMCFIIVSLVIGAPLSAPLGLAAAGSLLLPFLLPQPASGAFWVGQAGG